MKKLISFAAFVVVFALSQALLPSYVQGQEKAGKHPLKMVFHVSDTDQWGSAVSNLKNLTAQYPEAKLRVIINGTGLYPLQSANGLTSMLAQLAASGVQFQVCHNALRDLQIAEKALPSFVTVIPAAIVGLAESQYDGYTYIKP